MNDPHCHSGLPPCTTSQPRLLPGLYQVRTSIRRHCSSLTISCRNSFKNSQSSILALSFQHSFKYRIRVSHHLLAVKSLFSFVYLSSYQSDTPFHRCGCGKFACFKHLLYRTLPRFKTPLRHLVFSEFALHQQVFHHDISLIEPSAICFLVYSPIATPVEYWSNTFCLPQPCLFIKSVAVSSVPR